MTTMTIGQRADDARGLLEKWTANGDVEVRLAEQACACGWPKASHGGASNRAGIAGVCQRYRRDPVHALVEKALIGRERTFRQDAHEYDRKTNQHERRRRAPKVAGEWSIGPSDVATCRKAIEYRERPPEDYHPAPSDKQAAHMGSIVHEGFRRRRKALYPWRQFEQDVTLPGLDRPGRFDEYDPIIARCGDAKSAGKWMWEQVGKVGVPTAVVDQTMLYAYALRLTGKPVEDVEVIYINRENGAAESFLFPYDEQRAVKALTYLRTIADTLDLGMPLPRDRQGPSTDPICGRFCAARRHCWNMDEADDRGASPEYVTLVKHDPDVQWALEQYDTAREAEGEAKREKERMKALIEGADYGQYGTLIYKRTGGNYGEPVSDMKARVEQLETFYEMSADERPPLADLPWPTFTPRSAESLSIKRERVAKTTKRAAAQAAIDADLIGFSAERAATGLPGHCDRCATFGHRKAHLSKGCADVGCQEPHGDEEPE